MTELLTCPFCGSEPELNILYEDVIDEKVIDGVVIRCAKCGISKEKLTVEAATNWWNTRTIPQALAATPAVDDMDFVNPPGKNPRTLYVSATPAVGGEAMVRARSIVESHIFVYGYVPNPDMLKDAIAAALAPPASPLRAEPTEEMYADARLADQLMEAYHTTDNEVFFQASKRLAALSPASPLRGSEITSLELAEVIHKARWPEDRQMAITPFADEDNNAREYSFRIARAIKAAFFAAPPEQPALRGREPPLLRDALQQVYDFMMEDHKTGDSGLWTEPYAELFEVVDEALSAAPTEQPATPPASPLRGRDICPHCLGVCNAFPEGSGYCEKCDGKGWARASPPEQPAADPVTKRMEPGFFKCKKHNGLVKTACDDCDCASKEPELPAARPMGQS